MNDTWADVARCKVGDFAMVKTANGRFSGVVKAIDAEAKTLTLGTKVISFGEEKPEAEAVAPAAP